MARHRQRRDRRRDRACRRRDQHDPRRRGRHHAAQPRAAGRSPSSSARSTRCSPAASTWASAARPARDQRVARALRRTLDSDANAFPQDVIELQSYFADDGRPASSRRRARARSRELWILGSSTVRRAARRDARPALRLRLALRARCARRRRWRSTAAISARRRSSRKPLCDGRLQRLRRRHRRRRPSCSPPRSSSRSSRCAPATRASCRRPSPAIARACGAQGAAMLDHVLQCSAVGTPRRRSRAGSPASSRAPASTR